MPELLEKMLEGVTNDDVRHYIIALLAPDLAAAKGARIPRMVAQTTLTNVDYSEDATIKVEEGKTGFHVHNMTALNISPWCYFNNLPANGL